MIDRLMTNEGKLIIDPSPLQHTSQSLKLPLIPPISCCLVSPFFPPFPLSPLTRHLYPPRPPFPLTPLFRLCSDLFFCVPLDLPSSLVSFSPLTTNLSSMLLLLPLTFLSPLIAYLSSLFPLLPLIPLKSLPSHPSSMSSSTSFPLTSLSPVIT